MSDASLLSHILPFGVLDLCKRKGVQTTAEAISNIVDLAELTDHLGYSRYWLAEHHVPYAASSAPELLLALIAARSKRIRIGTGGTIIKYYSPYRIAEIASTLQTISAGRFDLGLCRGPGVVDEAIAQELVSCNSWELGNEAYLNKVTKTVHFLFTKTGMDEGIRLHTPAETRPQLWILGSSSNSVMIANNLQLSLALALFITRDEDKALANNTLFKASLHSGINPGRKSILAVSVVCADTDEKASMRHKRLTDQGMMQSNFVGSYKNVTDRLINLLRRFEMDELLIVLLTRDHSERMETYGLLAENYNLTNFYNRGRQNPG